VGFKRARGYLVNTTRLPSRLRPRKLCWLPKLKISPEIDCFTGEQCCTFGTLSLAVCRLNHRWAG
jgi:hypothetical protein